MKKSEQQKQLVEKWIKSGYLNGIIGIKGGKIYRLLKSKKKQKIKE